MATIKPESVKTQLPVLFIDSIPLHRCKITQDGMGVFYGKTETTGLLAYPIKDFDKNVPPKGYTRFTKGSHYFSSITKGYTYPKVPLDTDRQLAPDFRAPKKDSIVTANQIMTCTLDGVGLGNGVFTRIANGDLTFYIVHADGYPATGKSVKVGQPIAKVHPMSSYHFHIYCLYKGKQYDFAAYVFRAGQQYDIAEKKLDTPVVPPVPAEDPKDQIISGLRNDLNVANDKILEQSTKVDGQGKLIERQEEMLTEKERNLLDSLSQRDELKTALEECQRVLAKKRQFSLACFTVKQKEDDLASIKEKNIKLKVLGWIEEKFPYINQGKL